MQDILLDDTGDIIIENGDLKIGESLAQEVQNIITLAPGQLRTDGYLGVDIFNELQDEGDTIIKQKLKAMLKRDNKRLIDFKVENNKLYINAEDI